ncbi:MAG: hypothetical protein SRB1_01646 [Desulfobacteraceae bacterium Eth-SRB1]|nr:MAG: hypothetical protein SRB1_01646 [Desulfobacteraceae bacterium Eth-SRB1]
MRGWVWMRQLSFCNNRLRDIGKRSRFTVVGLQFSQLNLLLLVSLWLICFDQPLTVNREPNNGDICYAKNLGKGGSMGQKISDNRP